VKHYLGPPLWPFLLVGIGAAAAIAFNLILNGGA